MATLTKTQILKLAKTNDKSKDWGQWSAAKCERERHRYPEIDAALREGEARLKLIPAIYERTMKAVDPDWKPGDDTPGGQGMGHLYTASVRGTLAHHFNMHPDELKRIPWVHFMGLVRAYSRTKAPAVGNDGQSVPMTLKKIAALFGWKSTNTVDNNATDIGLRKPKGRRGSATFALSTLSADQRREYESKKAAGEYGGVW